MKKNLLPLLIIAIGSLKAYSQTTIDVGFAEESVTVHYEDQAQIKVNINSAAFPPGTILHASVDLQKSTLMPSFYSWQPQEIPLCNYTNNAWILSIPLAQGTEKKELYLKLTVTATDATVKLSGTTEMKILVGPKEDLAHKPRKFTPFGRQWDKDNIPRRELAQYTDFLGFGNDRPNGLLQQKFLFKWPLNKKQFSLLNDYVKIQPFRSIIVPNVLFNRIDKAKDDSNILMPVYYTITSNTDNSGNIKKDTVLSPSLNTFDLLKFSSLKIESRLVLVAVTIGNTRIYVDAQGGVLRNRIKDSLNKSTADSLASERIVYTHFWGAGIYAKSLLNDKDLNIELEGGFNQYTLKDNFFRQYDMFVMDNGGKKQLALPVGERLNRKSAPIWYGSISLRKDWGAEKNADQKNSLFFRMNYSFQKDSYNRYNINRPKDVIRSKVFNHYLQLQLGIALNLDKIFSNG